MASIQRHDGHRNTGYAGYFSNADHQYRECDYGYFNGRATSGDSQLIHQHTTTGGINCMVCLWRHVTAP